MNGMIWSAGVAAAALLVPAAASAQATAMHMEEAVGPDIGAIDAQAQVGDLGEWEAEFSQWEAEREEWGREAEEYQLEVTEWQGEIAEYRRSYGFADSGPGGASSSSSVAAAYYLPYVTVTVTGAPAAGFFYLRQNYFMALSGTTYADKVAAVAQQPAYGPHPDGKQLTVAPGYNYYFFPICGDAPSWQRKAYRSFDYDSESATVTLSCGGS
jgi:hypothetical protein